MASGAVLLKFPANHIVAVLVLLLAVTFSAPSRADAAFNPVMTAELTLPDAIDRARQQHGGRVLSASRIEQAGRVFYRIKLLQNNGRVITVIVDAVSGSLQQG